MTDHIRKARENRKSYKQKNLNQKQKQKLSTVKEFDSSKKKG